MLTPVEKSSLEASSRNKAGLRLGKFELILYASSPSKVRNSLETTLADTGKNGNVKLEKIDMIGILSNPQEFFSHALATRLSKVWGINMPVTGAAFVKKNKIRNAKEVGQAPTP